MDTLKIIQALSGSYDDGFRDGYREALRDIKGKLDDFFENENLIDRRDVEIVIEELRNER